MIQVDVDHSRVEVAADARRGSWSCGFPPRMGRNEADAVRSARPKGRRCRH